MFARNHVELLQALIGRAIRARYRGTALGFAWCMISPLIMLALYTLVFVEIMRARWPGVSAQGDDRLIFALMVYAGMALHALLAEVLMAAPTLIQSHVSYVKRVVFPLEILPVVPVGVAAFNLLVSMSLLLVASAIIGTGLHWSMFSLPLVLLPPLLFVLGLSWLLSMVGTYFRDVAQLAGFASTAFLFISPVLYPRAAVPPMLGTLLDLNPLTWPIEAVRAALLEGAWPQWGSWGLQLSVSACFMLAAWWLFCRAKRGFADVL